MRNQALGRKMRMSAQEDTAKLKVQRLEPLRCPHCHKLLLTEKIKEGTVEVVCKRCGARVRLEVGNRQKIIRTKG